MKTRTKSLLVAVLTFILCVTLCVGLMPIFASAEDTNEFILLTDTTMNEDTPVGTNNVAIADAQSGITVSGKQVDSRSVVVYDHGYSLGSKINLSFQWQPDTTGMPNDDSLKGSVYFALFFAQVEKDADGFNVADFKHSRSTGNGLTFQLYTIPDYLADATGRASINLSAFGKRDILNCDSFWNGLPNNEGLIDTGWALKNNKPIQIEMGTEKSNGEDHFYFTITVDRSAERTKLSVYKMSFPLTDLVKDATNQSAYYVGYEICNLNGTERSASANISNITAEESALTIEPESLFLKPEQTAQLTVKDALGTISGATYTPEDASVVSVSDTGLVTALKAGSTKITVTAQDGRKGEAYVTVANNITLDKMNVEMFEGEYITLKATTNPNGLGVVWSTSDDTVVTVDNGVLTGVKAGTATITATVKNFETGDLELKATCQVTVSAYTKPDDVYGDYNYLYSDSVIVKGTGYATTEKGVSLNADVQNGYTYIVVGEGVTFEKAITFDVVNKYDVNNTTYANQFGRFLGISIANKATDATNEFKASDFALGATNGLQINWSTNAEWWSWGGKFMLPYQTGVAGTTNTSQTPQNTGSLTGTDKFANAFARAFCDGTRIQVKMWKDADKFYVSFTPVFTEGEVPDGSENMSYPGGNVFDYVGPYTLSFDWASISNGAENNWSIAVGVGNTLVASPAKAELSIENVNIGILSGVSIDRTSHQMKVGNTFTLHGETNPNTYVATSIEWSSSDETVATVENGVVTALKAGKTTITYTVDGQSASCEITVVGDLTVSETEKTLVIGETYQISATVSPADVKATFASGDERIATVDENGLVTAVKEGEVTIYVRVGSLFVKEVTITVVAEKASSGGCGGQLNMFNSGIILSVLAIGTVVFVVSRRKNNL